MFDQLLIMANGLAIGLGYITITLLIFWVVRYLFLGSRDR